MNVRDHLNPGFSSREAVIQRIGWGLLALVPIAAIAEFLGGGIFSDRTLVIRDEGDSYTLTYARWGRMHSDMSLELEVSAPGQQAATIQLGLSSTFARHIEIGSISPEPDSTSLTPGGLTMQWQVEDWSEPLLVLMHYVSNKWTVLEGQLDVRADSRPLASFDIEQFLFP